jgi:hypothetical protein
MKLRPSARDFAGCNGRMEHRWGHRFAQDTAAEITTADGVHATGKVKSASLSGAFVQTGARLPLRAQVSLRPQHAPEQSLDAKVVRVEEDGLALEWMGWPGMRSLSPLLAGRVT